MSLKNKKENKKMDNYDHSYDYAYRNDYTPLGAFEKTCTEYKYIRHMEDCIKPDNGLDSIINVNGEEWISPECVEYLHGEGIYEDSCFDYFDYTHGYYQNNRIDDIDDIDYDDSEE